MKQKEKQTIQAMAVSEIRKQVAEARGALANYTVNRYSKQSKNTRERRGLRKRIAVLLTMVHEKETQHG